MFLINSPRGFLNLSNLKNLFFKFCELQRTLIKKYLYLYYLFIYLLFIYLGLKLKQKQN